MVFDEIYYGGDVKIWGDVIWEVFGDVICCFVLMGILFCSDDSLILFVSY